MRIFSRIFLRLVLLVFCLAWQVQSAHAALTITDDLGRRMTLPHSPKRIISLAPSVTEIMFAVGAGRSLVADTIVCDYPSAALRLPHVGGPVTPSAEKILALHPDLVIMADQTISASETDILAMRWRCPVYVTAAATYAAVEKDIADLGALAGKPEPTRRTLAQMQASEKIVQAAVRGRVKPHVFVMIWQKPLITAGGSSFIGDLVRLSGGVNVAEQAGESYPTYAPERLLAEQPDIILTGMPQTNLDFPGAAALRAVRSHHVYAVTGDLTDRPGPRLGLGLLAVAKALHPEAFPK